jgi:hypothetical protein
MGLTGIDSIIPDYNWKMTTVLGGIYFVFICERLLKVVIKGKKVSHIIESKNNHIVGTIPKPNRTPRPPPKKKTKKQQQQKSTKPSEQFQNLIGKPKLSHRQNST